MLVCLWALADAKMNEAGRDDAVDAKRSERDKSIVEALIRQAWPGVREIPQRGLVTFPPVRDGGTTDALIKLAVELADEYYSSRLW